MKITLTKNKETQVDDWVHKCYDHLKWFCGTAGRKYYATRTHKMKPGKWKSIRLHNLILWTPEGMEVDHINGDSLDNRLENLRIVNRQQNCWNSKKQRKGYKGVTFFKPRKLKKPWVARIRHGDKKLYLGYYATEKEAAKAYDRKAKKLFGEYANTNF